MDQEQIAAKAREIEDKFNSQWGTFTRTLAGHPKTALAIGFGAGVALGTTAGRWALGVVLGVIF